MTDITDTLMPNSDQLDAVDLLNGPRTFTVESVKVTNGEQPVSVTLAEFPRVWRPGKNMRRVLAAGWGVDSSRWTGHAVTLFCDPKVRFGGSEVGGTRIRAMSHIDKPLSIPLLVSKGKTEVYKVDVLKDVPQQPARPQQPTPDQIEACTDRDQLRAWWPISDADTQAAITARAQQLNEGGEG